LIEGGGDTPREWHLPSPRQVLLAIGIFTLLSIIGGGIYSYAHRGDSICPDGRLPLRQKVDVDLGKVQYLCHNGQIVTKSQ
jgi:hypothetical protein